jgi:hypothetical protein
MPHLRCKRLKVIKINDPLDLELGKTTEYKVIKAFHKGKWKIIDSNGKTISWDFNTKKSANEAIKKLKKVV